MIRDMGASLTSFEQAPGVDLQPEKQIPVSEQPIRPNSASRQSGNRAPSPARGEHNNNHVPVSVITPGMRARQQKQPEPKDDADIWDPPSPGEKPERESERRAPPSREGRGSRGGGRENGDGPPGKLPAWARGQQDRAQNLQRAANESRDDHGPPGRRRKPISKPAVPRQSGGDRGGDRGGSGMSEAEKRKKRMEYDDPMGAVGPRYKVKYPESIYITYIYHIHTW